MYIVRTDWKEERIWIIKIHYRPELYMYDYKNKIVAFYRLRMRMKLEREKIKWLKRFVFPRFSLQLMEDYYLRIRENHLLHIQLAQMKEELQRYFLL